MARPPTARVSWVLLVILAVAIAVGATASILVNPNRSSPSGGSSGPIQQVVLPNWVFAAGILGVMVVVLIVWVLIRLDAKGQRGIASSTFMYVLFAIGVICLIVALLHLLGIGGGPPNSQNNTGTGPGGTPPTTPPTPPGRPLPPGAGSVFVAPSLPTWLPLLILVIVAVVAVVVGVPQTRRYLADRRADAEVRRRANAPQADSNVRAALSRASFELDLGQDPRTVILALYSEMLVHLRPMVGDVETSTPEEIRTAYLEHFGVRPAAARTLTRLFEEARYSTHPLGPAERDRAQDAVRATIDDLDRRASPT